MRRLPRFLLTLTLLAAAGPTLGQQTPQLGDRYAIIVGGPGGQPEFTERYYQQTRRLYDILSDSLGYASQNIVYLFEQPGYDSLRIDGVSTAENITKSLERLANEMQASDQLALFLIGHGSFDGEWAKFNLVGPDLRDIDYARLLATLPTRRVIVVNFSSASGPFISKLSGKERVIVTATKSGAQHFETNFTDFFLDALTADAADRNKDKRISLQEAFSFARTSQDRWFEDNRRLRAEHPLLDDNGDGEGSQNFDDSDDGLLAARVYLGSVAPEVEAAIRELESGAQTPRQKLMLKKLRIEQQIEDLKARKAELPAEAYSKQLEALLIQLAKLNREIKALPPDSPE